jgi:hypothetical protein
VYTNLVSGIRAAETERLPLSNRIAPAMYSAHTPPPRVPHTSGLRAGVFSPLGHIAPDITICDASYPKNLSPKLLQAWMDASVHASSIYPPNFGRLGSNPLTHLESALTKNSRVTALESADPKSLDLKSFRIRTYKNWRGEGGKTSRLFKHQPSMRDTARR